MGSGVSPNAVLAEDSLRALADPGKARTAATYFKTGPGEYGEGDRFYGIRVPQVREVARQFNTLSLDDCAALMHSPYNEARLMALDILTRRFAKGKADVQTAVFECVLQQRHRINNWNLVDGVGPYITGPYLLKRDRSILWQWAQSPVLWERRLAVLSTFAFIRAGDFDDALKLYAQLLTDPHDLMHKACGWMLRELGKRDETKLLDFLQTHYTALPRTTLRYAMEKFTPAQRAAMLKGDFSEWLGA
ncbi:DNA alkylation repair protein [Rhodoferax saidenbachensis]|uniref:3-methyladenine DNA glycosylase AlkD n=1 Tax=Rhodoferax saidenbachensis TaxID=1484693 RepID=A0ABU1ZQI6_9BURK|nr:DNA alkylation repair protein [Rhodoferax saidenbachensis]MDR7307792.1 3-methyladenine DNA glycosylase AlkD [Rhodoferax saidenbachensis]